MQLAYELLPVWAGQDDQLPMAISHLRRCSRLSAKRRASSVVRRTPRHILSRSLSCVVEVDPCVLRELCGEKMLTAESAKIAKTAQPQSILKKRVLSDAELSTREELER
jgi:hypothetical protein